MLKVNNEELSKGLGKTGRNEDEDEDEAPSSCGPHLRVKCGHRKWGGRARWLILFVLLS